MKHNCDKGISDTQLLEKRGWIAVNGPSVGSNAFGCRLWKHPSRVGPYPQSTAVRIEQNRDIEEKPDIRL